MKKRVIVLCIMLSMLSLVACKQNNINDDV